MDLYAIIVAGGTGSRMKTAVPKQFINIGAKPILMHTIQKFYETNQDIKIILGLPPDQLQYWKIICKNNTFEIPVQIAEGGKTRFQTVKNCLKLCSGGGLVAIHDGVRPFVTSEIITESYKIALEKGNGVAAVKLKDSVRMVNNGHNNALDRSKIYIIQTPQTFRVELIKKAFESDELPQFTDDASVLEKLGEKINLFEGSYSNIKITTPDDLVYANALLAEK